jgi:predicted metal-dependent hydrolase
VTQAMRDLMGQGINFFNAGRYFEAHEAWEDLWRETTGDSRLFYQGLVQAAVGLHHLRHRNLNGARAQLTKSVAKLAEYPPRFCGIDNANFLNDLRKLLEEGQWRSIVIVRDEKPVIQSEG